MKINLIASFLLLLSFLSQEKPLSEVVHITPPKKSESMDWVEHYKYMLKNYRSSPAMDGTTKCFNKNGIIITFWDNILWDDYLKKQVKNLSEMKASKLETLEELGMSNDIDKAEIIKVNDIGFFISCTHVAGDEYRYNFDSEYRNYKSISGRVVCKKQDRKKAEKIFNDLLKSIKFK
ncbi:hypothetical protein VRU48_01125 [Pedobacter sp. KR3-3]|uniref:Uncharacterized protein n=1 Tax=Pedobacter albus TaxID=3113905 RepID=A0ABU7I2M0_9SPHI|nr:hypothetical protein [Pedobacter sp. KR3-3]MEE1943688.1 hypothetical protein [Pedobacter sp. KR3-3]